MSEYGLQVNGAYGQTQIDSTYANYCFGGYGSFGYVAGHANLANQGGGGSGGDSFYALHTITFGGSAYDFPPNILIRTGFWNGQLNYSLQAGFENPNNSCTDSCPKGTNMFIIFRGFNVNGSGKYTGFDVLTNRIGLAHGNVFEYTWFINPNEPDLPAGDDDGYGLKVMDEDSKVVFHSGHKYFKVVDQLHFPSSSYQQQWNGNTYWGRASNTLAGGYYNEACGYWTNETTCRWTSLQTYNGFHGFRTGSYDTIAPLPEGYTLEDDVWFCINGMSSAKNVETAWNRHNDYYSQGEGEEWWNPIALWWESDGKVHFSGTNGGNNYLTTSGGGNHIKINQFLGTDNTRSPRGGSIYIPVCILMK